MSLIYDLPTKLIYDRPSYAVNGVVDFERYHIHLWNISTLTQHQHFIFDKTVQWHNIWIARQHGYEWCLKCKDKGFLYGKRGIVRCNCAATGYKPVERIKVVATKRRCRLK